MGLHHNNELGATVSGYLFPVASFPDLCWASARGQRLSTVAVPRDADFEFVASGVQASDRPRLRDSTPPPYFILGH